MKHRSMKAAHPPRRRRAYSWLQLFVLIVAACDSAEPAQDLLTPALQSAVDGSVVPAVTRFAEGSRNLEASVAAFCEGPSESALVSLQDAWLQLSRHWNQAGIYFIGPLNDDVITPSIIFIESMRQRGTDYTDTVTDTLKAALADSAPLEDAFFEGLAFNRVGMLALEVLLFEDSTMEPPATDAATIAVSLANDPRKCRYLQGMAALLSERATTVEAGWVEAFGETGLPFRDLLLQNMLADGSDPSTAVLLAAIEHIEYLRVRKLDGILDVAVATRARPEPSPFYANLTSALDALQALMEPPDVEPTFFGVMLERGFEAEVGVVRDAFDAARAAVAAQDRDATKAAFLRLETSFRREVPRGLGVNLGLTFSDGD